MKFVVVPLEYKNCSGCGGGLMGLENSFDGVADFVLNQLVEGLIGYRIDAIDLGVVGEEILEFGHHKTTKVNCCDEILESLLILGRSVSDS